MIATLKEYQRKRHFDRTPEPAGEVESSRTGHLFVVQKHDASRLHYDFRFELDGVLKSWAVPKGPSLDPAVKALAVQVEDHPLDYAGFEGVIPEDQYGGGTVMVWDRGQWFPEGDPHEGLRRGKLEFELRGEKLAGAFALVRMGGRAGEGGKNWLLIKKRDEHARLQRLGAIQAEMPDSVVSGRTLEEIERDGGSRRFNVESRAATSKSNGAAKGRAARDARPPRGRRASAKANDRARVASGKAAGASDLPGARPLVRDARPVEAQLATLVNEAPDGDEWLHETKIDGYRILAHLGDRRGRKKGEIRLISRNGKDWTERFASVAKALEDLDVDGPTVLDGEVVLFDGKGRTSFQEMQNFMRGDRAGRLTYVVFDLPRCEGYDLNDTPLIERKEYLRRVLARAYDAKIAVRFSEHRVGAGDKNYAAACARGHEGIVSKRVDARYEPGRSYSWVKVKCTRRQEFVIGGYTDPQGARERFGALLLGYHDETGRLRYAGKVGTGYTRQTLEELWPLLHRREQARPPFENPPTGHEARGVHWIKPELVAEIEFTEWTSDGSLRHPTFEGLREDKPAKDVIREIPKKTAVAERKSEAEAATANGRVGRGGGMAASPHRRASGSKRSTGRESGRAIARGASRDEGADGSTAEVAGVRLSNPDRVLYPEQGITKHELAEYYAAVADWMLPHVAGRPLSFVRCPRGQGQPCFFQRHVGTTLGEAVRTVVIHTSGVNDAYAVVDNAAGLVSLAQMGILEVHPWGSRADKPDRPDRLVFDLDPDPAVEWPRVIEAARALRDRMETLGLPSFVKTSGGKGLHVVVPIDRRSTWEEAREFTQAIAREMVRAEPDRYLAHASKAQRRDKIFVDYLRNSFAGSSVAPYSPRAKVGAPVSMPLIWSELTGKVRPDSFTIANALRRLGRLKRDPWEGIKSARPSLAAAAKRM